MYVQRGPRGSRVFYGISRNSNGLTSSHSITLPIDRSLGFSAEIVREELPILVHYYYLSTTDWLRSWSESVVCSLHDSLHRLMANKEYDFMGLLINIWYWRNKTQDFLASRCCDFFARSQAAAGSQLFHPVYLQSLIGGHWGKNMMSGRSRALIATSS